MKIAQIAPLYESVPPKMYGGTERIVSYLTEKLVEMGHEVTLFATGDSETQAHLEYTCTTALRLDPECVDPLIQHVLYLEKIFQDPYRFDIIHNHSDYLAYPFARRAKVPFVTTLHGRLDIHDLVHMYEEFPDMPVVSISEDQRKPIFFANWVGNVYHGLPKASYTLHPNPGKYLAFVGRISPEKGVDAAIEIAKKAEMPLKIAAKVSSADKDYYNNVVKPLLDHPLIEFVGEITEKEKDEFLGNAYAFLFPIDWPEPFGLVVIESMACGTPTITRRRGSMPELIKNGENGFIVENEEEAVEAIKKIPTINRETCRKVFEDRFSDDRMADEYLEIYKKVIEDFKAKQQGGNGAVPRPT